MSYKTDDSHKIIAELEKYIKAQSGLLVCYRCGRQPTEKLFDALERGEKFGIEKV